MGVFGERDTVTKGRTRELLSFGDDYTSIFALRKLIALYNNDLSTFMYVCFTSVEIYSKTCRVIIICFALV